MTRIKHKISPNVIALVAAAIIVLGLFFTLSSFIDEKRLLSFDYMNNQFYDDEQIVDDVYTTNVSSEDSSSDSTSSSSVTSNLEHYIGYLEIPKLGFRRGFYNIDSALNTVEANIEVIKGSSMPDVENGNLIIAGHSGTGWKAFFNDLHLLEVGDEARVLYQGNTYIYQITNIYKDKNTGRLAIKRDYNKTTLTLVTCTNNDSSTQTIYIAELLRVE
ncbi:MAG TPA: sortase [Candidatus Onthousia faecigallinarum]|nr:sortase [Candidatus Onthousia faecigallinarum]